MKYIMIQRELPNTDGQVTMLPVIFPSVLTHVDIANAVLDILKKDWPDCHSEIISAGEVSVSSMGVSGFSDTLKLSTGNSDHVFINFSEYMYAWEKQPISYLKTNKSK